MNTDERINKIVDTARKHRNSQGNKWGLYNTLKNELELLALDQDQYRRAIIKITEALDI